MKKLPCLSSLFAITLTLFGINTVMAAEQSGHGGAYGGKSCVRAHLANKLPAHLATVAPGSAFSFAVFDIDSAQQIAVTVKQKPVEIASEYRAPTFFVTGKIPDEFRNTVVRVTVKINSQYPACRLEEGWLVKISE
ncbi:hypothetical protein [Crenothrix polyspora]|uniref:Uncharacterized protein n=1 Tax=Crenothrix polyspora TaxID=360316 RepID=A0A1R4H200_9GAMM|nr:hypothetical protein [Crenothrix polyspora]SJM90080.1 conserved exported hypothetical protein [Crenothrix polyspora]